MHQSKKSVKITFQTKQVFSKNRFTVDGIRLNIKKQMRKKALFYQPNFVMKHGFNRCICNHNSRSSCCMYTEIRLIVDTLLLAPLYTISFTCGWKLLDPSSITTSSKTSVTIFAYMYVGKEFL